LNLNSYGQTLLDTVPDSLQPNVTSYLVYDNNAPLPKAPILDEFTDYDDFDLVPYDKEAALPEPDYQVTLSIAMINRADGKN
jgi:iron transport multicopper oxidase